MTHESAPLEGARPAHHGGEAPPLAAQPRGWYVPRKLPHFDSPYVPQAITFRLADSLPVEIVRARAGPTIDRRRIETALDAGHGACLLRRPEIAALVVDALLHGNGSRYDLHAFTVMPKHVHVLLTLHGGSRLGDVLHGWKSWSAKQINRMCGREGRIWQRDYFDRYIRDEAHFWRVLSYIENNPVASGLTSTSDGWRFGSAAIMRDRSLDEPQILEGARPALLKAAGRRHSRVRCLRDGG